MGMVTLRNTPFPNYSAMALQLLPGSGRHDAFPWNRAAATAARIALVLMESLDPIITVNTPEEVLWPELFVAPNLYANSKTKDRAALSVERGRHTS